MKHLFIINIDYSKCGLPHYKPFVDQRARIVGGKVVKKRNRWPWAVKVEAGKL